MATQVHRNRSLRYIALAIAILLAGALAASVGLMIELWHEPDDADFGFLAPWLAGGIASGAVLWLVIDPGRHRRHSKRRRHSRSRRSRSETR